MGFRDPITDVATGTDISNVETLVNTVKAKTDNLPAAPANEAGKVATVDSRVAGPAALEATAQSIKTKTDTLGTTTGLPSYRQKASGTGPVSYPQGGAVFPAVGVGSFGAYSELVANIPSAMYLRQVLIAFDTTASGWNRIQVAKGAAGNEVVIWETTLYALYKSQAGLLSTTVLPVADPIVLASGTRLAIRSSAQSSSLNFVAYVVCIPQADLEAF